ncbi:SAC3/GANP family protein [Aphelenchoides besseyi]|nr:SAC3/GANP family protein [Aphelenchoides besseyi]
MATIVGLCEDKCPQKEREFRIKNHLLHPLESRDPFSALPSFKRLVIPERVCKSYSRPAANQNISPNDVRTLGALQKTSDYLRAVEKEFRLATQWPLVYQFLIDRYRAVRADIRIQQLNDPLTAQILESMICFYVRAILRCEKVRSPNYDSTLHRRELEDCFGCWIVQKEKSEEIRILHLLYSAHQPDIFNYLSCERDFFRPRIFATLRRLFTAIVDENFVAFFRVFSELETPLQKTILTPIVSQMRLNALNTLMASSRSPNCTFPIAVLQRWLGFYDEHALRECLNEFAEFSLLEDEKVKFHGAKLNQIGTNSLGYSWYTYVGSQNVFQ